MEENKKFSEKIDKVLRDNIKENISEKVLNRIFKNEN